MSMTPCTRLTIGIATEVDAVAGVAEQDRKPRDDAFTHHHRQARQSMLVGGLLCAGGLLTALATYSTAAVSVPYVVAWIVIILGASLFFQGLAEI